MYQESFQVNIPVGLHGAPIDGLRRLPPGTVFIDGRDVTHPDVQEDMSHPAGLNGLGRDAPVTITARGPDQQTERDLVHLAMGIINKEQNLWPGKEGNLPVEPAVINQWANLVRAAPSFRLNLPQEGPVRWPQEKLDAIGQRSAAKRAEGNDKSRASAPVKDEMTTAAMLKGSPYPENSEKNAPDHSPKGHHLPKKVNDIYNALMREHPDYGEEKAMRIAWSQSGEKHEKKSRWEVVALGELQQPGGVGATQEYNPVTDGPNPDQPPQPDNSNNSFEQSVALETWVNYAVDMLNRGEPDEAILAKLAHDGCPDPGAVLKRAQGQPVEEKPISDEIGQDPFQAPTPADQQTGQMESLERQPPVLGRVRIARTSMTGVVVDRWEDLWGQGQVRVALDGGGTMTVAPEAVHEVEGEEREHPVSQIEQFISELEPVEPTRPHIEARIANLELVRRACRDEVGRVGFSDQVKIASIDSDAQKEILSLKEFLGAVATEADMAYLADQRPYRVHGLALPGVERVSAADPEFNHRIAEEAAVFVTDLPEAVAADPEATAYAAATYASSRNGDVPEFVRLAEEHRVVRTDEFTPTERAEPEGPEIDAEGPAEGLFI